MVTWPTRAVAVLAPTASPTVPDALADWPSTTVIHAALLAAVHRQPESVVTPTLNRPPVASMVSLVRDKEKTQGAAC
jgi:hypothetical protein